MLMSSKTNPLTSRTLIMWMLNLPPSRITLYISQLMNNLKSTGIVCNFCSCGQIPIELSGRMRNPINSQTEVGLFSFKSRLCRTKPSVLTHHTCKTSAGRTLSTSPIRDIRCSDISTKNKSFTPPSERYYIQWLKLFLHYLKIPCCKRIFKAIYNII